LKHTDGRYVQVCEVFGFFQQSFVAALKTWGFDPPAELELMKQKRGTFTQPEMKWIIAYCKSECDLLVALMNQLRDACRTANATPRKWIGAGSIASAVLARSGVEPHHAYDLDLASDDVVNGAVLGAYFGGRVELLHQGVHKRVTTLDIRSAYPAAATRLPSLAGAELVHRKRYQPAAEHAIWRVRWDMRASDARVMPFPVRVDKSIYYPACGTGTYHACEVSAAIAAGYPVDVIEGWVLKVRDPAAPFDWVPTLYKERARLQAAGDPAQRALKLGLNSVYGKLAQGYGYGSRPRWQSYFWAGEITARTRASVLAAAMKCEGVVMIATDGIFVTRPARLGSKASVLGSWERGSLDWLFAAQPGVYQGQKGADEVLKSRGFFAREIDYDELRAGYEREGADYVHRYASRRFVGLGSALARTDFSIWRRWVEEQRTIYLNPDRKLPQPDGSLMPLPGPLESEPYIPKLSLLDARALDYMQGTEQPMREEI
jgi:hypothetical protein